MKRTVFLVAVAFLLSVFAFTGVAQAAWPLNPTAGPHPIRAGTHDLRMCEWQRDGTCWRWHNAADIVVDERRCSRKAPARGCRRIYSVGGGLVRHDGNRNYCGQVRIGQFSYAHIYSRVREGKGVRAGRMIGWTCRTHWHIHLGYTHANRDILAADGPLVNRTDTTPPAIEEVRSQDGELWARIEDPVDPAWLAGSGLERLYNDLHPARIEVNGAPLWDARPYPTVSQVTAPPFVRNVPVPVCALMVDAGAGACSGQYWWRLGAFAQGQDVQVRAVDSFGNATEVTVRR